jgi:hypothetical protein
MHRFERDSEPPDQRKGQFREALDDPTAGIFIFCGVEGIEG